MYAVSMGQVLSRSFGLVRDNLMSVGLFLLIAQIAESALSLGMRALGLLQPDAADPARIATSASYLIIAALFLLTSALTWAGAVHGYVQSALNRPVSLATCFSAGLAKLLPVLLLTILWALAVGLGWMMLIIPGLILISMWSVAIPALVTENLPVTQSFGRSRALTRGHRLAIFGVLLLVVVVMYAGIFAVAGLALGSAGFMAVALAAQGSALVMIASGLVSWLFGMFLAALLSALYLELVQAHGSLPTAQLSEVFV